VIQAIGVDRKPYTTTFHRYMGLNLV
jgi:hypothetical protein